MSFFVRKRPGTIFVMFQVDERVRGHSPSRTQPVDKPGSVCEALCSGRRPDEGSQTCPPPAQSSEATGGVGQVSGPHAESRGCWEGTEHRHRPGEERTELKGAGTVGRGGGGWFRRHLGPGEAVLGRWVAPDAPVTTCSMWSCFWSDWVKPRARSLADSSEARSPDCPVLRPRDPDPPRGLQPDACATESAVGRSLQRRARTQDRPEGHSAPLPSLPNPGDHGDRGPSHHRQGHRQGCGHHLGRRRDSRGHRCPAAGPCQPGGYQVRPLQDSDLQTPLPEVPEGSFRRWGVQGRLRAEYK